MLQESSYKAFSEVVSPFDSTDTPWFAVHQFLEAQEMLLTILTESDCSWENQSNTAITGQQLAIAFDIALYL